MSDGELAFLGLLSLIFAPQELAAPLYCIEEPESHLHPHMLETLVEVQRQRQDELGSSAAQLIAATHSPQLVDKMEIEDLIVVEKFEGQTRFSRPSDDEELRSLVARKDLGLGDLWYTGALSRD
jgi:predicted ATPase